MRDPFLDDIPRWLVIFPAGFTVATGIGFLVMLRVFLVAVHTSALGAAFAFVFVLALAVGFFGSLAMVPFVLGNPRPVEFFMRVMRDLTRASWKRRRPS